MSVDEPLSKFDKPLSRWTIAELKAGIEICKRAKLKRQARRLYKELSTR